MRISFPQRVNFNSNAFQTGLYLGATAAIAILLALAGLAPGRFPNAPQVPPAAQALAPPGPATPFDPGAPNTPTAIGDTNGDDLRPSVDFCGANYLVAWQYFLAGSPNQYGILGRLVAPGGAPMGINFAIALSTTNALYTPDVAFNPGGAQEYLVVYARDTGPQGFNILARRVQQDGVVLNPEIPVATTDYHEANPAIASNPIDVEWLVVYEFYNGSDHDIRAQRIDAAGNPVGAPVDVASGNANQTAPDVAFLDSADQYLVVWQEHAYGSEDENIYGQRLNRDGSLLGRRRTISSEPGDELNPALAANPAWQEYLVTWEHQGPGVLTNFDIYARRVAYDGSLPANPIVVAETLDNQRLNPAVAYNANVNEYMLAWQYAYNPSDHDIFRRRVQADGSLPESEQPVSITGYGESAPALAPDHDLSYLTTWEDNRDHATQLFNIYGDLASLDRLSGVVYEGAVGVNTTPLPGVGVELGCSSTPGDPGPVVAGATTGAYGEYSFIAPLGCLYYNILEYDPAGYTSAGATSVGGVVVNPNWIQYSAPLAGKVQHANLFYDLPATTPTATATATSTATATQTGTATRTTTATATRTKTATVTRTATSTATATQTGTATRTPTRTATFTASPSPVHSPTPTATATQDVTWINFDTYPNNTRIEEQYASLGVHFINDFQANYPFVSSPRITSYYNARSAPNVLVNDFASPDIWNSANVPLVMWFDKPVWGVGMWLGTLDSKGQTCNGSYQATVRAYDCQGNQVAIATQTVSKAFNTSLQISDPQWRIQRVTIDYAGTTCPEAIDELAFRMGNAVCTDKTNPKVEIKLPAKWSILNTANQTLYGTINETGVLKSATLNGVKLPVHMSDVKGVYTFRKPVTLVQGWNMYLALGRNISDGLGADVGPYMLGAPVKAVLSELHLTQRGVLKQAACDIDGPLVAGKSALARIKLDVTTATGAPAYVTSVDLSLYRWDAAGDILVDTISGEAYPSNYGNFIWPDQMKEIHFWIPADDLAQAGSYRLVFQPQLGATNFGPPLEMTCNGSKYHFFNNTRRLNLLIVPVQAGMNSPLLQNTSHDKDLLAQLAATARTYPVKDFAWPYWGVKFQETAPFKMCDGTAASVTTYPNICLGTGWVWKHVDYHSSGVLNRAHDETVIDNTQGYCDTDDHKVGGRIKSKLLIPYTFDPSLGIFRPGAHPGWQRAKHQTPIDEDHDLDIDQADLSLYIESFFDQNQNKWLLYPSSYYFMGETFRFFYDKNGNNCNDKTSDYQAPIREKGEHPSLLWVPQANALSQYNQAIPGTSNDYTNAILLYPDTFVASKSEYGDIGPGQGECPGNLVWVKLRNASTFSHELGHNTAGLADLYYDNIDDDMLSMEKAIAVYVGSEKVPPNQVFAVMSFDRAPNRVVHSKGDYKALFDKLWIPALGEQGESTEQAGQRFTLSGMIDAGGQPGNLVFSLADGLELTPADEASPYALVFGAGGQVLLEYHFKVGIDAAPPEGYEASQPLEQLFSVTAPFPGGASWVELQHQGAVLRRFEPSAHAPSVQLLEPNGGQAFGGEEQVLVQWDSNDQDGDPLLHTLHYSPDGGASWIVLAANIGGNEFTWSLAEAPGTLAGEGLLRVTASDAFHQASDQSDAPFSVGGKPPQVAILAPQPGQAFLQCSGVGLRAAAYDPEGQLGETEWRVDGVSIGADLELTSPILEPGWRELSFSGRDAIGNAITLTHEILILADSDCDAMSDEFELKFGLEPGWMDDALLDNDQDDLDNQDEAWYDLDPTNPDTDGDGYTDGGEVRLGSNPADPGSTPVVKLYMPFISRGPAPAQAGTSQSANARATDPSPVATRAGFALAALFSSAIAWRSRKVET